MNAKERESLAIVRTDVKWIKKAMTDMSKKIDAHISMCDSTYDRVESTIDNLGLRIQKIENCGSFSEMTKENKRKNMAIGISLFGLFVSVIVNLITILGG
jgi:hypothetical protein